MGTGKVRPAEAEESRARKDREVCLSRGFAVSEGLGDFAVCNSLRCLRAVLPMTDLWLPPLSGHVFPLCEYLIDERNDGPFEFCWYNSFGCY